MHETNIQSAVLKKPAADLYGVVELEMRLVRERLASELTSEETLIDSLCKYVSRYQGKMLRPAILLLAGKCCGPVSQNHVNFAVVIELIHLATLIHDDVLDEAKTRRQSPTAHQLWGNEPSVLLGDLLLSKAFDLCNRARNLDAANELSKTAHTVCQGELLQCLNRRQWDMTEERYLKIIEMKTASLYQFCCRLGAKLSDASASDQAALEEYGRLLGCGFQIIDDLLDITGREDETGKTLGTDLAQGKPTLPIIHFCRDADGESKNKLFPLLLEQDHSKKQLVDLLERAGSLEYARNRARSLIDQALEQLQTLPAGPARESLAELADFVVKRSW